MASLVQAYPKVLVLQLGGFSFEIAQASITWAVNETPTAQCLLAVGRNLRTQAYAKIHSQNDFPQLTPATIVLTMAGNFEENLPWPAEPQVIFQGFFAGFAPRLSLGKVQMVARLIHITAALGFSSSITRYGHVSNPAQLNASALPQPADLGAAAAGSAYISSVGFSGALGITGDGIRADVWSQLKKIFCNLANIKALVGPTCGGTSKQSGANTFALQALAAIEGPSELVVPAQLASNVSCSLPYKWGVPLAMTVPGADLAAAVSQNLANFIGKETILSYAGHSFWDKLVGQFGPLFGLAFVPRATQGLVIADTPALSNTYWREITLDDYDDFDFEPTLSQPLARVTVMPTYQTMPAQGSNIASANSNWPLGCYAVDSLNPGDGQHLYVGPPSWLLGQFELALSAGVTMGIVSGVASKAAGAPITASGPPSTSTVLLNTSALYNQWAQYLFALNGLRGRNGTLSGKLRFDIAPGSLLYINLTGETFLGAGDAMASPHVACVSRVTVNLSAEAGQCGTSFQLSHVRSITENTNPRTSVAQNPLFGLSIHGGGKHGCPLVDSYEFPTSVSAALDGTE